MYEATLVAKRVVFEIYYLGRTYNLGLKYRVYIKFKFIKCENN